MQLNMQYDFGAHISPASGDRALPITRHPRCTEKSAAVKRLPRGSDEPAIRSWIGRRTNCGRPQLRLRGRFGHELLDPPERSGT